MIRLSPHKDQCTYVFISSKEAISPEITPLMTFQEREGQTYIIKSKDAKANNYDFTQIWSCISLGYESDLEMTGLTAAISSALSDASIPCNVVAAFYHDHIFVPEDRGEEAMIILELIRL